MIWKSQTLTLACNSLVVPTVLTRFQAVAVVTPGLDAGEEPMRDAKSGKREGLCQLRHAVDVQDMPGDLGGCL